MAEASIESRTIQHHLKQFRAVFFKIFLYSTFINIFMLVSPVFMMLLYNKVMAANSIPTLVVLTSLSVFLLLVMGALDIIRQRVMLRVGLMLDNVVGDKLFDGLFSAVVRHPLTGQVMPKTSQPLRDFELVRRFISEPTIIAFFDVPWVPFFLFVTYLMNPYLFWLSFFGAIFIIYLTIMGEVSSRDLIRQQSVYNSREYMFTDMIMRNIPVLMAHGMMNRLRGRWQELHKPSVGYSALVSDKMSVILGTTRSFRILLQTLIMALGGYLTLTHELNPAFIFAASIIMGRALAPVEMAISSWKSFIMARQAWIRLNIILRQVSTEKPQLFQLPRPQGNIEIDKLVISVPGIERPVLTNISMRIPAGACVAVIGPSGAGKSTFAQALVGVQIPNAGYVRLDNVDINSWDPEDRGQHIGYLPQDIELFDGTIAENISRFAENASEEKIMQAAHNAGCHELILRLPKNYNTIIGDNGYKLSGGQRQRIGLARALYDDPALLVLDEPNSNLDTNGEARLHDAIFQAKQRGATIIVITHNVRVLGLVDLVLVINDNTMKDYGQRDEILGKYLRPAGQPGPQQPPQPQPPQPQSSPQPSVMPGNPAMQQIMAQQIQQQMQMQQQNAGGAQPNNNQMGANMITSLNNTPAPQQNINTQPAPKPAQANNEPAAPATGAPAKINPFPEN